MADTCPEHKPNDDEALLADLTQLYVWLTRADMPYYADTVTAAKQRLHDLMQRPPPVDRGDLDIFSAQAYCPKCEQDVHSTPVATISYHKDHNTVHLVCARCGYAWDMLPADEPLSSVADEPDEPEHCPPDKNDDGTDLPRCPFCGWPSMYATTAEGYLAIYCMNPNCRANMSAKCENPTDQTRRALLARWRRRPSK